MINGVDTNKHYGIAGTTKSEGRQATEKTGKESQADQRARVDTVKLGNMQESPVTYSRVDTKKLGSSEIEALKVQAEKATEYLRKLVEQLILKQNKHYIVSEEDAPRVSLEDLGITTEDIEAAKLAISEDGEFGVKSVSDRLVNFAVSISDGDKSKLSELIGAIDQGFAAAKEALGGSLPDICQQTYDETMRKLNDWAKDSDESGLRQSTCN